MDASIQSLSEAIDSIANLNRKDPDFIHGEVVTSGHYQVTGVFGEISEKTKAVNNSQWEIEGVFYESAVRLFIHYRTNFIFRILC